MQNREKNVIFTTATCTGCGMRSDNCGLHGDIEQDSTYSDGKFVCSACYASLVQISHRWNNGHNRLSLGNAQKIQLEAEKHR